MTGIDVQPAGERGEELSFRVLVSEGESETRHEVTAQREDLERLGGSADPTGFVRRCFRFLLEREPKESILPSFDLRVIGRYFPEFEREVSGSDR